jgi:Ulp1 family protease
MRGIPEFNYPAFNAVAHCLRQDGHYVFNPAEEDIYRTGVDVSKGNEKGCLKQAAKEHGFSLRAALKEDLEFICLEANCIYMLPGWEKSLGANAEHRTAIALQSEGMEIVYVTSESMELMLLAHELYTNALEAAE